MDIRMRYIAPMVRGCCEGSVAAPRCHLFGVVASIGKALDLWPANTHLGKQLSPLALLSNSSLPR